MEYSSMYQYLKLIHDSKPDRKYSWSSIETTGDRVIIDVSIYFSEYDKQLVTVQLDGEISHAAIGGKLQHLFLECISSDRIKLIIECTKLRYLAHTAGGWPFVTLAKFVKQREGIAILVNCTEEYLTQPYIGSNFGYRYSDTIEDALQVVGQEHSPYYPKKFKCPICSKKLKIAKSGHYRCPNCDTLIEADRIGQVFPK